MVSKEPLTVRIVTATGQTDTYVLAGESFSAVSVDAKGLRWAMLNGGDSWAAGGLTVKAARASYMTLITAIDYTKRTLTTQDPLPADPLITVGNAGRRTILQLRGQGVHFSFADDLLIHEGEIRRLAVSGENQIDVEPSQPLLFAGAGNRDLAAFTMTNEDGSWQFRGFTGRDTDWKGGKAIKKPEGAKLTREVFSDANGDGFVNLKTYEIGIGDAVELLADVTLRRTATGYEVKTNVPLRGTFADKAIQAVAAGGWQKL